MTTDHTYLTLVAETGFDPATVTPISSRAERKREHDIWAEKAWARARRGKDATVTPIKRRPRKAAARVAAEQDER